MKLVFNPYYDNGVWTPDPGEGTCITAQKYVGPQGLVEELTMRLGLTSLEKPQHEILYSWYAAIKDAVAKAEPFYKGSFEIEPLAVAERLLAWRDALVMCGWTPETELPEKLQESTLLARRVFRKTTGEKVFIQKFLIWASNKADFGYGKYIFYHTDYSSSRKEPLKRDLKIATTEEKIRQFMDQAIAENVKKNYMEVELCA